MPFRRSKFGSIVDVVGIDNAEFIELTQKIICQSTNRHDFVEKMIQKLKASSIKLGEDILERTPEKRIEDQLTFQPIAGWAMMSHSARFKSYSSKEKLLL
jgi:hypothetical protein